MPCLTLWDGLRYQLKTIYILYYCILLKAQIIFAALNAKTDFKVTYTSAETCQHFTMKESWTFIKILSSEVKTTAQDLFKQQKWVPNTTSLKSDP